MMPSDSSLDVESRGAALAQRTLGPLLVASDGGDDSVGALMVARELADRFGAALEVVTVLEPTSSIVPPLRSGPAPLHRGATRLQDRRERMRMLCERAMSGRPRCSMRMLIGDVPTSIARAAMCHRALLVVTGRVVHGRIERAIRRETPLAVARAGPVPVLSVPSTTSRLPRVVVVAVGGGHAAALVGPVARTLFHDAVAIHLVSVEPLVPTPWERNARTEEDELTHHVHRAFAAVRASWSLPADVPIETHILTGDASDALVSFASAVRADLVVVGAAEPRAGPHLAGAQLATKLYRALSCAMLLVPVRGHATRPDAGTTSISLARSEWPPLLRAFAMRNGGRRASLTVDERGDPPRAVVRDWTLSGVDCDRDLEAIAIRLADPDDPRRHLSHLVAKPTVLALHGASPGCDELLVIGYADGQITLSLS